MTPPTGADTLQVREMYFRNMHSRHFFRWLVMGIWALLGTAVSALVMLSLISVGH